MSGTGLEPDSNIRVDVYFLDGSAPLLGLVLGSADGNGDFLSGNFYTCGIVDSMTVYGMGDDGLPVSDTAEAVCYHPD